MHACMDGLVDIASFTFSPKEYFDGISDSYLDIGTASLDN